MVYWSYEYPEPPTAEEAFVDDFYKGRLWVWGAGMNLGEYMLLQQKYMLWKLYGRDPEVKYPQAERYYPVNPDRDDTDIPF